VRLWYLAEWTVDGLRPRSGQAYGKVRSRYCPDPTDSSTRSLGSLGRNDKKNRGC
jgi:hypothetical protein